MRGDGSGQIMSAGDMAFVHSADDLLIYVLSDVTDDTWMADDPPYRKYFTFDGQHYVWSLLNLAYTTTAIHIPNMSSSGLCSSGHLYAQQFCDMLDYLRDNPIIAFPYTVTPGVDYYVHQYNSAVPWYIADKTVETGQAEVAGGPLRLLFFDRLV